MLVNIIGLGYIGLPTAALIASSNFLVNGVDNDPDKVKKINSKIIDFTDVDVRDKILDVYQKKLFRASLKTVIADVHIIVVPTPVDDNKNPILNHVYDAINEVIKVLKEGDLVIIESTCPVGTTQDINKIIIKTKPELKNKYYLAYCPERVLPGNIMYELYNNDRVIGGIDNESTKKAIDFYKEFVRGKLFPTNDKTAELCKLIENASRDNQIAFANEVSLICERLKIDSGELIDLTNKHPRVNILKPGIGVGGHCIPVDPYFLINNMKDLTILMSSSRKVNLYKTDWVLNQIINHIKIFEDNHNTKPIIGILGITYKPDVNDLRESPAIEIINGLMKKLPDYQYYVNDDIVNKHPLFDLKSLDETLSISDISIKLVDHKYYSDFKTSLSFC
ncbi:MAG: nucleotide sugar dehydrogenase [Flammeovirgaceae bacterium]